MQKQLSERDIEQLYDSGAFRIHQERSDFLLPQIVDFVESRRWLNLHPEYQRRLVWDRRKKSLLIESLLMNVPIPPVFIYEYDLNRYETMDGQQRLNAVVDFYKNRFRLSGLISWGALNGRTYDDCPPRIRQGLDRRRLSATVLLAESDIGSIGNDGDVVRHIVFERLNTGGQNLNAQELRNCIYSGAFNDLVIELAGTRTFNEIWDIPPYEDNIRGEQVSTRLRENRLFRRMVDCEIVLRFFAFVKRSRIRGAVKKILDGCMEEYRYAPTTTIDEFRQRFLTRLELARDVFGEQTFRIPENDGSGRLSIPLYDAVMVALDSLYDSRKELTRNRGQIVRSMENALMDEEKYEVLIGRPNTATAIKQRQDLAENLFREHL